MLRQQQQHRRLPVGAFGHCQRGNGGECEQNGGAGLPGSRQQASRQEKSVEEHSTEKQVHPHGWPPQPRLVHSREENLPRGPLQQLGPSGGVVGGDQTLRHIDDWLAGVAQGAGEHQVVADAAGPVARRVNLIKSLPPDGRSPAPTEVAAPFAHVSHSRAVPGRLQAGKEIAVGDVPAESAGGAHLRVGQISDQRAQPAGGRAAGGVHKHKRLALGSRGSDSRFQVVDLFGAAARRSCHQDACGHAACTRQALAAGARRVSGVSNHEENFVIGIVLLQHRAQVDLQLGVEALAGTDNRGGRSKSRQGLLEPAADEAQEAGAVLQGNQALHGQQSGQNEKYRQLHRAASLTAACVG